ncbi:hypothetical protein EAI_07376 [Harpegnathos saltator]|uniref:Uncharacterized protein n=1 Tax=Harpegnathos saltator TaxID=610380 RepID=E2BIG3_HARSA|nr:hypothetical protein EAI_07376 [Harpegnathos saltator]
MFTQKTYYFSQLSRSYPILRLVDIYDRQSFIRAYVLDNIYICILTYVLFYVALWYATNKLDRLILLKSKKAQFEEVIVRTTDAQKVTTRHLEDEMCRLDAELITTSGKIAQLEKIIGKILEPSFPPSVPAEPPPRKYGIFVSRPPGQRRGSSPAAAAAATAGPPKIGFK